MFRKIVSAFSAIALALIGLTVFGVSVASAHDNVVSGVSSCQAVVGSASWTATWTVENDYPLTELASLAASTGGGTLSGLPAHIAVTPASVTVTQSGIPLSSSTATLKVHGVWSDGFNIDSPVGSVSQPHGCVPTPVTPTFTLHGVTSCVAPVGGTATWTATWTATNTTPLSESIHLIPGGSSGGGTLSGLPSASLPFGGSVTVTQSGIPLSSSSASLQVYNGTDDTDAGSAPWAGVSQPQGCASIPFPPSVVSFSTASVCDTITGTWTANDTVNVANLPEGGSVTLTSPTGGNLPVTLTENGSALTGLTGIAGTSTSASVTVYFAWSGGASGTPSVVIQTPLGGNCFIQPTNTVTVVTSCQATTSGATWTATYTVRNNSTVSETIVSTSTGGGTLSGAPTTLAGGASATVTQSGIPTSSSSAQLSVTGTWAGSANSVPPVNQATAEQPASCVAVVVPPKPPVATATPTASAPVTHAAPPAAPTPLAFTGASLQSEVETAGALLLLGAALLTGLGLASRKRKAARL